MHKIRPVQSEKQNSSPVEESEQEHEQSYSLCELFPAIKAVLWKLALKFGTRTTIHGMNRLFDETAAKYQRLIWLTALVSACYGAFYIGQILSDSFNAGKFETIVDNTRAPVYLLPFPVVSICNQNRLNWERLTEAKQRFLPNERDREKLQLFERIIAKYDNIRFAHFDVFDDLNDAPLHLLLHVNFTQVFEFMTWRCEELLMDCVWNHYSINCCEIFFRRRSKYGLCWAFNTLECEEGRRMQRLDPMWPWHTGGTGPTSGLNVRVLINPEKHYPNSTEPKGINARKLQVMVFEPNVWHKDAFIIPENTQTILEVEPVIYYFDNNTRSMPSSQRECVFSDERDSKDFRSLGDFIYMYENCDSACHQEYLLRYCNCTLDLMFPTAQYPACRTQDLPCLSLHNEYFRYSHRPEEELFISNPSTSMVCSCFSNCMSINYQTDMHPAFLSTELRNNLSYVDLDVHFRFETMMVYRTRLIFDWLDLLIDFGGIVGLFLGCSLISTIELIYFGLIDLPLFVWKEVKQQNYFNRTNKGNSRFVGVAQYILTRKRLDFAINENGAKRNEAIIMRNGSKTTVEDIENHI